MHDKQKQKKSILTAPQSFAVGGIAGALDAAINHPLWTTKMRMQMNAQLSFNPQILYQGVSMRIASKIPITAIQVGVDTLLYPHLSTYDTLSPEAHRYISAFSAGACSALVYTPLEMAITQMEQKQASPIETLSTLAKTRGMLSIYTGFFLAAIREGGFALSFLAAYPALKTQFSAQRKEAQSEKISTLLAGVSAGALTAFFTHPADTARAAMQQSEKPKSILKTTQDLYQNHGVMGFFKGVTPRMGLVTSSIVFINETRPLIEANIK